MDDLPRPSRHHAGCNNPYMDDFPRGNAKEEIVQVTIYIYIYIIF